MVVLVVLVVVFFIFFRRPPAGYPGQTTLDPGPWPPVTVDLGRRSTKILTSEGAPLSFFPPFLQYRSPSVVDPPTCRGVVAVFRP